VTALTLDAVRAAFPRIGLAIYAYDPGKPLTLEVHAADGQVFTFTGATEADVLARAFPLLVPAPEPEPEQPSVFD
jgi:hypothetical protein